MAFCKIMLYFIFHTEQSKYKCEKCELQRQRNLVSSDLTAGMPDEPLVWLREISVSVVYGNKRAPNQFRHIFATRINDEEESLLLWSC